VSNILTAKFYEVQDYLTLTQHVYNPQIVMISKSFWDKLNEDEKKLIQDAANEARDYQRQVSREQDAKMLQQLKDEGVEVSELPPEEVEKFRAAVKPVIEKHSAEADPDLVKQLYAAIQQARGKS
jgi:TRAP-type C4-dicarboxylate transport system substrate-binding protein